MSDNYDGKLQVGDVVMWWGSEGYDDGWRGVILGLDNILDGVEQWTVEWTPPELSEHGGTVQVKDGSFLKLVARYEIMNYE